MVWQKSYILLEGGEIAIALTYMQRNCIGHSLFNYGELPLYTLRECPTLHLLFLVYKHSSHKPLLLEVYKVFTHTIMQSCSHGDVAGSFQ